VDWDKNNSWLVEDVTDELTDGAPAKYSMPLDRAKFFRTRYKLDVDIPKFMHEEKFIPVEHVPAIKDQLHDGDFVNVVRVQNGGYWVGHTGLIIRDEEGGETYFLESTPPRVKIHTIEDYIAGHQARDAKKPEGAHLAGFKFLRLREDPLANLRAIDGPNAPVIKPPSQTGVKHIESVAAATEKK
jgi:hypothetical protein